MLFFMLGFGVVFFLVFCWGVLVFLLPFVRVSIRKSSNWSFSSKSFEKKEGSKQK